MFLGRYVMGDLIPIPLWNRTASAQTPTAPSEAPYVRIYDQSDDFVTSCRLPIMDPADMTAMFQYLVSLDNKFAVGFYDMLIHTRTGGIILAEKHNFEIVAGGNEDGRGIELHFFNASPRNFVLMQTDGGKVLKLRNPRVTR